MYRKKIENKAGLVLISSKMHDSEFGENDFGYNPATKEFFLKSLSSGTEFMLKLFNVESYNPVNLNKVKENKATAGVFNKIIIKSAGRDLTLISQDLRIQLKLNKLEGDFSINQINALGES